MLTFLFLQALAPQRKFSPPLHINGTAALKRALQKEYLYCDIAQLSSGDRHVTIAYGGRTSGILVRDILVYTDYRPRGVKTRSQILAAYLYGRSGIPHPRIVKANGDYSLLIEYTTKSKRKVSETISLSLFHPIYRPL